MPTLEVEKSKRELQPWMKAGLALLGIAVLAGAVWVLWQWRVAADKAAFESAMTTQKMAGLKKDYTGAIASWEKYRNGIWPRNYYYEATLNEASLYQTMRKDSEALKLYRTAEPYSKGKDTAAYEGIASISEHNGDYATAIKYYQKVETIYATMNIGTSEWEWTHTHIEMLKQKEAVKNAK